jgi:hypothetical protein
MQAKKHYKLDTAILFKILRCWLLEVYLLKPGQLSETKPKTVRESHLYKILFDLPGNLMLVSD